MPKLFDNIRDITGLDDTELRDSLKFHGWVAEFPALVDENNIVLVGHRRIKIAQSLRIEPVIKKLKLGKGDEADAERLKLALVLNLGSKPLTAADRKRIAEHLYGDQEWTMARIAKALNVGVVTVHRDLDGFSTMEKPFRPKGGRPKGKGGGHRNPKTPVLDRAREIVRPLVEADQPVKSRELQKEHGISHVQFETAVQAERARMHAEPLITPDMLSMSAQEKLALAIKQEKKKLAMQFEQRVRDEATKRMEEILLPHWQEQIKTAKQLYDRRKGLMDKATFDKIRRCLHPDSRKNASDEKIAIAFHTFMGLEKYLFNEKDSPTDWPTVPSSVAEWDAMRAKATAERRAKRGTTTNGLRRR